MMEGRAIIQGTDMPFKMQALALSAASRALDVADVTECRALAAYIKKEFDGSYGRGWQCVVGSNFGCFFTHRKGTFIYFRIGALDFLVFRGTLSPAAVAKGDQQR